MSGGFVLRIAPSGIDRVDEALQNDTLIIGWAYAEGLLDDTLEWDEFRQILQDCYYAGEDSLRKAGNAAGHMWRFIREMKKDDLVVVPHGSEFYVGQVDAEAMYDRTKVEEDTAYRRPIVWLNDKKGIPRSTARSALISRMRTQGTCANATDLLDQIQECLDMAKAGKEPSFKEDLQGRLIDQTLDELRSGHMDDFGFERFLESLFRGLGAVDTKIVPRRMDKGIDIYATFLVAGAFRQVVGIQAKHWRPDPPVGAEVVRQLVHGIEEGQEAVTLGMVVTSGTFSDDADLEAQEYRERTGIPIELVDGRQLGRLIVEHGLGRE